MNKSNTILALLIIDEFQLIDLSNRIIDLKLITYLIEKCKQLCYKQKKILFYCGK